MKRCHENKEEIIFELPTFQVQAVSFREWRAFASTLKSTRVSSNEVRSQLATWESKEKGNPKKVPLWILLPLKASIWVFEGVNFWKKNTATKPQGQRIFFQTQKKHGRSFQKTSFELGFFATKGHEIWSLGALFGLFSRDYQPYFVPSMGFWPVTQFTN